MADTAAEPVAPEGGSAWPVATVVAALVLVAAIGVFFWSETYQSPSGVTVARSLGTSVVNGQTLPHVALDFATYPDSTGTLPNGVPIHKSGSASWPAYGPSNVMQVPANALVTVTVKQYDSGGALNNPWFSKVWGTVGGTATVTSPDGKTQTVSSWDPNNVGHTFTVRGIPGTDPNFFLSVPLPTDANLPTGTTTQQNDFGGHYTVTFSFISGKKGKYAWNCEFPCGQMVASFGGVMSAYGFMSGYLNVV